ncbi:uncharacterized protein PV07_02486 [Cladophialophora immunda]|uniref:EKC/KEOPS complex subunit CGI121 n=1 Tax=Cladophialophora immunda TaxID=569365 RepID=A0A0D2CL20_9EURO|nr:uncharacterized protein PV07_02486 [Cladophialophora immunda]KIW30785.1 hypothetical protein PV07_02486 [Cladophialophora immunda]OQU99277.1 hypothetical protein CLAIMM_04931 [Cladophialophora immunda]
MVEIIQLAHMPPELALYVAMYTDVQNAPFLKEQLLAGNSDFEYAFIDARMVVSASHVLAAAFRAMNDYLNERLRSRNIHSEIVFSLSPNNNIGEAFRRFGVSESTSDLLVLKVATTPEVTIDSVTQHLSTHIQGQATAFDDAIFRKVADIDRIRKIYKLNSATSGGRSAKSVNGISGASSSEVVDETKNLEVQILGLMALRGAT